jgi:hypothetical protein
MRPGSRAVPFLGSLTGGKLAAGSRRLPAILDLRSPILLLVCFPSFWFRNRPLPIGISGASAPERKGTDSSVPKPKPRSISPGPSGPAASGAKQAWFVALLRHGPALLLMPSHPPVTGSGPGPSTCRTYDHARSGLRCRIGPRRIPATRPRPKPDSQTHATTIPAPWAVRRPYCRP